jgi:hypothetical protein
MTERSRQYWPSPSRLKRGWRAQVVRCWRVREVGGLGTEITKINERTRGMQDSRDSCMMQDKSSMQEHMHLGMSCLIAVVAATDAVQSRPSRQGSECLSPLPMPPAPWHLQHDFEPAQAIFRSLRLPAYTHGIQGCLEPQGFCPTAIVVVAAGLTLVFQSSGCHPAYGRAVSRNRAAKGAPCVITEMPFSLMARLAVSSKKESGSNSELDELLPIAIYVPASSQPVAALVARR